MSDGDYTAVEVGAFARVFETPEASFLIAIVVSKPIITRGGFFGGRQVTGRNVETGASARVLVQGESAVPPRRGMDRLPKLIAKKFRLGERVAVPLVDRVRVGRLVVGGARLFGPALDFGFDAGVIRYFAGVVFLRMAVWKRARGG